MNFKVEDIMALPMLKEGKLTKNIKQVDIREAIDKVISIHGWTINLKKVNIQVKLQGFASPPVAKIDEGLFLELCVQCSQVYE